MKKRILLCFVLSSAALFGAGSETNLNYAEALQKSLYFYEAQQSGPLSPNNRVEWRGPSCMEDGADIGRDLTGGWFDAGDHWTANLTMSFAATTLAWSAIEEPEGYIKAGQMRYLLENLVYVNRYFLKCILNPDCKDPANELEVAIGCGGREGVEGPNVHAMWAGAEVAHLMTKRPTFRLTKQVPGGDIPGAMAAAMAASSMVIREHGSLLKGIKGYEVFDSKAFADRLLEGAEKLVLFGRANAGPVLTDKLPKEEQDAIRKRRNQCLRSDGKVVEIGYRSEPFDKLFTAATFLQRAHLAKDSRFGTKWYDFANSIYDNEYKAENYTDWWKDFGAGNFGRLGAYNMMRLAPNEEKFHAELQLYTVSFCKYKRTPGGLRLREWFAHEYGSLRHANNAAVIALYYSQFVGTSPQLKGNAWWKEGKSNEQLAQWFFSGAKRQVDYALGDNPYHRSYMVGFGTEPFNNVHHRGAYGAWAGFEHFIPGKGDDRKTSRHILYGALVAGPDHNDVFLCGKEQRAWLPMAPNSKDYDTFYKFPNRAEPIRKEGYTWDPADIPVQDVMDSQYNEVALDYNAGLTASLAWLTAKGFSSGDAIPSSEFPPKEARNNNTDLLTTDREFFVTARRIGGQDGATEIEAALWNRSRWPTRVTTNLAFRYYFTLPPDVKLDQVDIPISGAKTARVLGAKRCGDKMAYVEITFANDPIYPGNLELGKRIVRFRINATGASIGRDWSAQEITDQFKLTPKMPVFQNGEKLGGDVPEQ